MNNVIDLPVGAGTHRDSKLPAGQRLLIMIGLGVASWAALIGIVAELTS